jgi:GrpB-like predicted nucleotidyltransferase (UPF0157 family)
MKRIVQHDPSWAAQYENEARLIAEATGAAACALHHIGSTAIPGLGSKPIIDILLEALSLQAVDGCAERLVELGYEVRGEYGIAGRRYFSKKPMDRPTGFHLHAYLAGSFQIRRHLVFRDYLILKPEIAAQDAALKAALSFQDGSLKPEYQEAKKPFVDGVARETLRYFETRA